MGVTFYTMEQFHDKGVNQCIEEAIEIATRGTDAFYITFDIDAWTIPSRRAPSIPPAVSTNPSRSCALCAASAWRERRNGRPSNMRR